MTKLEHDDVVMGLKRWGSNHSNWCSRWRRMIVTIDAT